MPNALRKSFSIIIAVALAFSAWCFHADAKGWETSRTDKLAEGKVINRSSDVEIRTVQGLIVVSSNKPVQVKIFSILGQLISSDTLPAGVSQINLGTHGMFIIKIGDLTCRVAL